MGFMSSSWEEKTASRQQIPESIRIVNWSLRDSGLSAWAVALLTLAAAIYAGQASHSWAMGIVWFTVLFIVAWRVWIPVTFDVGKKGVTQVVLGLRWRIPWSHIAGYQVRRRGVLLLADPKPSSLAPLRGVYIQWKSQRDELIELLEYFLAKRQATPLSTTRSFKT